MKPTLTSWDLLLAYYFGSGMPQSMKSATEAHVPSACCNVPISVVSYPASFLLLWMLSIECRLLVLATVPGLNRSLGPSSVPDPFKNLTENSRRVVTSTGHKPMVFWPGWNRPTVPTLRFQHLWLQLSIWVVIVSWHDQYVDCAVLTALSLPAFRSAIGLIFVEWLWHMGKVWAKLAGFW